MITVTDITAALKQFFGPRDGARGTYAAVCATMEALRGPARGRKTVKEVAARMEAFTAVWDPLNELLYTQNPPFYAFVGVGGPFPPLVREPPAIRGRDIERWQAGKNNRRR